MSTMMATAQRMTTSTITIATFKDNDGDDATGNADDVDGNGATEDDIDDEDCDSAMDGD